MLPGQSRQRVLLWTLVGRKFHKVPLLHPLVRGAKIPTPSSLLIQQMLDRQRSIERLRYQQELFRSRNRSENSKFRFLARACAETWLGQKRPSNRELFGNDLQKKYLAQIIIKFIFNIQFKFEGCWNKVWSWNKVWIKYSLFLYWFFGFANV